MRSDDQLRTRGLMRWMTTVVLGLAACGRHDVVVGVLTGTSSTAPMTPFGAPVLVEGLLDPTNNISDPTLSVDMLEIYFASNKNGSYDIWMSTRAAVTAPWSAATLVTELSTSTNYEAEPSLSGDGLTLWFTSNRPTNGLERLWVSHRPTVSDPWGVPEMMDWGTSNYDRGPTTDITDLNMVFYSQRVTNDPADLYLATRDSGTANWSPPANLTEVNSTAIDWDPGLFANGLGLMFGSTRGGLAAPDLYETARSSLASPFSQPVARTELNSQQAEGDPWLSNDGRYVIFASTRSGVSRLYEARR
jgi:WD40-like Beta Propeller Repeat